MTTRASEHLCRTVLRGDRIRVSESVANMHGFLSELVGPGPGIDIGDHASGSRSPSRVHRRHHRCSCCCCRVGVRRFGQRLDITRSHQHFGELVPLSFDRPPLQTPRVSPSFTDSPKTSKTPSAPRAPQMFACSPSLQETRKPLALSIRILRQESQSGGPSGSPAGSPAGVFVSRPRPTACFPTANS